MFHQFELLRAYARDRGPIIFLVAENSALKSALPGWGPVASWHLEVGEGNFSCCRCGVKRSLLLLLFHECLVMSKRAVNVVWYLADLCFSGATATIGSSTRVQPTRHSRKRNTTSILLWTCFRTQVYSNVSDRLFSKNHYNKYLVSYETGRF